MSIEMQSAFESDMAYIKEDGSKVYVEDELCYSGKPGIIGKMAGVELLDTINKDVKTDE